MMLHFLTAVATIATLAGAPSLAHAQNAAEDVFRAQVVGIIAESESEQIPGLNTKTFTQTIDAVIISGNREGQRITVSNNYVKVAAGDRFIAARSTDPSGVESYFLQDVDRMWPTIGIMGLFALTVAYFAGTTGIRSLFSLAISLAVILMVLVPLLLTGINPVAVTIFVSAGILATVMYITHGWKPVTHAAFLGTVVTVTVAGVLASIAVSIAHLSGFASDEAVFLNTSTGGAIDLAGLLLGAIIVGALGLLDDIAVTQSATVLELKRSVPDMPMREVYTRAMAVGREHIGALVNTLALAYAGVSLPLLMLASTLETPWWMLVNQEVFATEIIRTAVGGIALVLAVPLSTLFAVRLVRSTDIHTHTPHSHGH